jgi:hypothetical protein
MSADGRWVAFTSAATNLVPGDTNGFVDAFVARTGFDPVHPVPSILSLNRNSIPSGNPTFLLQVSGTNFVPASRIRWDGLDRPTFFINKTKLLARIPAGTLLLPGAHQITVFNPPPSGGTSNGIQFSVN